MKDWRYRLADHRATLSAAFVFVVIFTLYGANHDGGFNANVLQTAANRASSSPSWLLRKPSSCSPPGSTFQSAPSSSSPTASPPRSSSGSPIMTALGVVGVVLTGILCGALNGVIVVYGRLQPIVATIATGAIFYGAALALRPDPGGDINSDLADAITGQLPGGVPASVVTLVVLMLLIWVPFRRSVWGARCMPSARPSPPPTCRACRSAAPSCWPTCWPACSLPWAV